MSSHLSDIDIARKASTLPISEIGATLGIPESALHAYGKSKAKIDYDFLDDINDRSAARLVLVTAITPTPAGEGKTTTTVGLGDALNRIGKRAVVCIREPSLGPCFGVKGGAAGGGYAQVVPMEDINLHFTGDLHAIGAAHNLLSALVDNHIYWNSEPAMDSRRVVWRRVVDINDRALRSIVAGLGGVPNGFARETGFDITVASEIMAIFCLARSLPDLSHRLGNIIVGRTRGRDAVTARDLEADGAMAVLLKDALMPNLVQTLENNPAFVHGGPFANIAHGCNSLMATRAALGLSEYVVTEAGFGADLGAEKFFNIKCRKAGLRPDAAVVVASVRALKSHGGAERNTLATENPEAVSAGMVNLRRHVRNITRFGVPPIVAINRFNSDTNAEIEVIRSGMGEIGVPVVECTHWAEGSAGAEALAEEVVRVAESGTADLKLLYPDELGLAEKMRVIARDIYDASDVGFSARVTDQLDAWQDEGYGDLPVCMAKTPYSFSTDASLKGAPSGHVVVVNDVRLSAGAGFVVAICGDIMTMPGLPREPAAKSIRLDDQGQIQGLF